MKARFAAIVIFSVACFSTITTFAQDTARTISYWEQRERDKILPDKVFEIGLPLLLIFLVVNTALSIFKIKAEARLKEKAMDKGISEATLVELFRDDKVMVRNTYLKWFLVLASLGIAFIYIHMLHQYVRMSSGFLALGLISLFLSLAFLIYYRITRRRV